MILPDALTAKIEKMEQDIAQLQKRYDELHDIVHLIRSDLATQRLGGSASAPPSIQP